MDEQIGKILSYLTARQQPQSMSKDCPDEETLANYLAGHLAPAAGEKLEAHLADCAACLGELSAARLAGERNEAEAVPQRITDRAMALLPAAETGPGAFDVIVRLIGEAVELVSASDRWAGPPVAAPAGVRGKSAPAAAGVLQLEKEIGNYKLAVELERAEAGLCQVVVRIAEKDEKPAQNVRLSLASKGREQASYLIRQGRVVFDSISPGEYTLALSNSSGVVGTIRLTIEEGHDG